MENQIDIRIVWLLSAVIAFASAVMTWLAGFNLFYIAGIYCVSCVTSLCLIGFLSTFVQK